MRPLCSVELIELETDGSGSLAAVHGRATWVGGAGTPPATTANVRRNIFRRKDAEGRWCIAQ
jgi:ketosteroid isomerase-like protein